MQMTKFEVSESGSLRAWYEVLPPEFLITDETIASDSNVKICFHLTDEGLIVDLFDHDGNCVTTYAKTAQEFADWDL